MDILIKNMEMPKNCGCCPLAVGDRFTFTCMRMIGKEFSYELAEQRQEDCPLVELPNNHGRIVDLDKVLDWLVNEKRVFSMAMSAKVVKALSDAPVILEASDYECPHYQGVCGLDESIICFSKSNRNCDIRLEASNGHTD